MTKNEIIELIFNEVNIEQKKANEELKKENFSGAKEHNYGAIVLNNLAKKLIY